MEKSDGTKRWIAKCRRLLDRLVEEGDEHSPQQVTDAFEAIFGLLQHLNEGDDTIIFFADEAGAWQVGVDWEEVVPAYSSTLSELEAPETCAKQSLGLVNRFASYKRDDLVRAASDQLPPDYGQALMEAKQEYANG
jgi:hypothetical protein